MIRARTKSADDTRALAAEVAPLTRAGDVVLLAGDLGAGKTTFTQGFARACGVTDRVTSPTFVLVRRYDGDLPVVHVDVYRLDHLQEVVDLGLAELLDDDGVALIEWGDAVMATLPADFLEVRMLFGDSDDERTLTLNPVGPRWAPRMTALQLAVDRWAAE